MPPKMKVPEGELTAPELRKLIRAHNILVTIKIPKGTDRLGLIKLIEGKGYKVDHKKKAIIDSKADRPRRPQVTLKNAIELTKPKPVSEEEKKKRQQARQKKKGEKAFLKVAIPKAPPVSKKPTKVIKVGKPPPKEKKKVKPSESKLLQQKGVGSVAPPKIKPASNTMVIKPKPKKKEAPTKKEARAISEKEKIDIMKKKLDEAVMAEIPPIIYEWYGKRDELLPTLKDKDGNPIKKGGRKPLYIKEREKYRDLVWKKLQEIYKKIGFSKPKKQEGMSLFGLDLPTWRPYTDKVPPQLQKLANEKFDARKKEREERKKKVEPKKVEPKKVEPKKVEPKKVEPKKVEPKKVEPKKVEPVKTDKYKVPKQDEYTVKEFETIIKNIKNYMGTEYGRVRLYEVGRKTLEDKYASFKKKHNHIKIVSRMLLES